jgi:flavin reductase (DIM6/NTAB) family NADH-FMN oxidoreductase RutF
MKDYKTLIHTDIKNIASRTRSELINKISGFKSPVLVGTVNSNGIYNLSIISSIFHIGSNPPLLGMILRPYTEEYSHTLKNIMSSEQFTISHIHHELIDQAHRCSTKFPDHVSEFKSVGLTPILHPQDHWVAPAVSESKIRLGLSLNRKIDLPNKCNLIVGNLEWIESHESLLNDNKISFESNNISVLGLYNYYINTELLRLDYQALKE